MREIQNLAGQPLARHVYDTGNERVIKVDVDPATGLDKNGTVYYRDESGLPPVL